jgi:hypothetical protein
VRAQAESRAPAACKGAGSASGAASARQRSRGFPLCRPSPRSQRGPAWSHTEAPRLYAPMRSAAAFAHPAGAEQCVRDWPSAALTSQAGDSRSRRAPRRPAGVIAEAEQAAQRSSEREGARATGSRMDAIACLKVRAFCAQAQSERASTRGEAGEMHLFPLLLRNDTSQAAQRNRSEGCRCLKSRLMPRTDDETKQTRHSGVIGRRAQHLRASAHSTSCRHRCAEQQ